MSGHWLAVPATTRSANRRTGRAYRWSGASSRDRRRLPREVVRPKVNSDGRQAQNDANPEDRRMMDQSSVARSGFHSITSSAVASKEGGTLRPSALAVLRLITNSNLVGACTGRSGHRVASYRFVRSLVEAKSASPQHGQACRCRSRGQNAKNSH